MKSRNSLLSLIGNTPLVKVQNLDTGKCELFLKMENYNPGGSIKDRIGISMIEEAEKEGKIAPGTILIEATAGNTGLGLSLVASQKGYPLILVIPDKMSSEKINHLRALGAKVIITRSDVEKGHPEYYQNLAEKIARETPNSYFINQFNNFANPLAHEKGTAPEIWEQMEHKIDAIVCGVGSGGTLTGVGKFMKKVSPNTEVILADPFGSILADQVKHGRFGNAGSWAVEGIGEDFIPSIAELEHVTKAYTITDRESFNAARLLLQKEGVLAGSSSGTLLAAALKFCQESQTPKRVVTFICDTGNKYLSKMYNDFWLADMGFSEEKNFGDLRDIVTRPHMNGSVTYVHSENSIIMAHNKMRTNGYSKLPVIVDGKIVGVITKEDILNSISRLGNNIFANRVADLMTDEIKKLDSYSSTEDVFKCIGDGFIVAVYHKNNFYGLITSSDLLNYSRRNYEKSLKKEGK